MMRLKNNLSCAPMRLFLLVCLWAVSLSTMADSGAWYFTESKGFTWMTVGDCEIEYSIPVFIWDSSSNDAVTWGYIYVTPEGESETSILYYAYDESRDQDKPVTFKASAEGEFKIVNTTSGLVAFTRNNGSVSWVLKRDADDNDHHTAKIRWKVPYQWRGKKLKMRVKFRYDDRYSHSEVEHKFDDYDCPQPIGSSITLMDPMLAFDKSSAGYIMIPWYAQLKTLSDAKLTLIDAATGHVTIKKVETSSLSGYVNVPMDRPYSSVILRGKAVASDGTKIPNELSSNPISVPMLHTPTALTATMRNDGKVVVRWQVDLPELADIMDNDMFDIQRNMTGSTDPSDASWVTIGQELYERNKMNYEILDSTMLDGYQGKPVTYRVRRQATTLWGWTPAAKYAQVQIPAVLSLFGINNATVTRSATEWNDDIHKADFAFNFSGPETSPSGNVIIRSVADFERFAQRVNNGEESLGAYLAGDIDLGESQTMVGTKDHPYKGIFDGNGYTLTVHYKSTQEYTAPFRYVVGAYFSKLKVAGTIASSAKFSGGIVGQVMDKDVTFSSCQSSVTLDSSVDGDATNGGFVAHAINGRVGFFDCLFDGSFLGEKCHSNGGFVGWIDQTTYNPFFHNCYFKPARISTKMDNCRTFARANSGIAYPLEIQDCYYSELYDGSETTEIYIKKYFIIRNADDWKTFGQKVNEDPNTNAILIADITITESIGTIVRPFMGTFNGNGHTINCNINPSNGSAAAPFSYVGGATIWNLHVTGTIRGTNPGGLVKYIRNSTYESGGTLVIHNVRVSADIIDTSDACIASGFIGNAGLYSVSMVDCLFDGTITATSWDNSYAAPFICNSYDNPGPWFIRNCYENGTYTNIKNLEMCYRLYKPISIAGAALVKVDCDNSNYSTHDWSSVYSDNRNVGKWSNETLIDKLGTSNWTVDGDMVVPEMAVTSVGQGMTSVNLTDAQLLSKLGENHWKIVGNAIVPSYSRESGTLYGTTVWDQRAKLQLRINMHGEKGVESKLIDLSGNDKAIKEHQFTQELSRKCVDYSFDLIVERGKSPLPIVGVKENSATYAVTKADQGDKSYRFQNSNRITKLEATAKQSSVLLQWETTGGDHDFFRVLRRQHDPNISLDNEKWPEADTIATNLNQLYYEDKTVLVQQDYDYRVESVYQCEGTNIELKSCTGACVKTGRIDGYIRMSDGTAMGGVTVECRPDGDIPGAQALYTTTTNDEGYFEFKNLPFNKNGRYKVTVPTTGSGGNFVGPNSDGLVYFSQNTNWSQGFNFYMDNYFVYSGHVYYRDTSVPVPGVSFKLDGNVMHDASNQVIITDNQGAFALSIPRGPHTVQAVKDNHYFANDGFLVNHDAVSEDQKYQYNFVKDVPDVYLWDSTTVMLRGRVAGGDIEGNRPLGNSLSKNNLGDSLKIVIQLEGDNASWLIRKQDDETVKSATYKTAFGAGDKDTTRVDITRHTLTVRPDAKTGEYQVMLHPAKYKVIEVSAKGYATLFQDGKVGETVDLSFNGRNDTVVYNRIYHAVPTVKVKQFNPSGEDYFGVQKMISTDIIGNKSEIHLWYNKKDQQDPTKVVPTYSFGYPVFMAGSPYGFTLQACEMYYWNNNSNAIPDVVNLNGGKVTIKNAMLSNTDSKEITLDKEGTGSYIFTPENATFDLTDEYALKHISITLEYDNSFYDVKPLNGGILQGFVMATRAKAEGRKTVATGVPILFDILRDPPGGGSYSYIEEGSKMSYGYSADLSASVGVNINTTLGSGSQTWETTAMTNMIANGVWNQTDKSTYLDIDIETSFGFSWVYNYNIDVTERIQTNSGKKWVGPKGDLFIGASMMNILQDALTVTVIPDSVYQTLKLHEGGTFKTKEGATVKVPVGTIKVLAQGTDDTGNPIYLTRNDALGVSNVVKTTFVHSQFYIENELLPDLIKLRNSLLLPKGYREASAQTLADKQGYPAYVSEVDKNDEFFGFKYKIYWPKKAQATVVDGNGNHYETGDSISSLNQEVAQWMAFLAKNEQEKLSVMSSDLVKRYDFDGGAASIQYSENFTTSETNSRYLRYPLLADGGAFGGAYLSVLGTFLKSWNAIKADRTLSYKEKTKTEDQKVEFVAKTLAVKVKTSFTPILEAAFGDKYNMTETHSKKIGFTLATASKSSLSVEVYRTANEFTCDSTNNVFIKLTEDMMENVRKGRLGTTYLSYLDYGTKVYSDFVFRTIGGVTCEPYEGERKTKWFQPGTVLDVATIPADKPRIWVDEPVVSNVPYGEPARFTLHIANETDYPEQASPIFQYFIKASSNPKGAKVLVDGSPVTTQGTNITLYPVIGADGKHTVFTKKVELYPATDFDYEDITFCLMDPDDNARVFECQISAHFIPSAGKVKVSVPSNNWVMNTESPKDGDRQAYYMPVRIEGFDVNWPNFDHIELQYKLSNQGDKDWVNVCSYYADKQLQLKASGVTDTIPTSGIIVAPFYGEKDPVEQYYDIRAVTYCRHAGGYLTGSSEVLKGIKDTRRPVAFGTPEPTNGILGIGDDILIKFSEPIAGNYLRDINNFEVLGTLLSNDISTSTSLSFDGNALANTQGERNLMGKSFTVDVMLNPAPDQREMTVFAHGGDEKGLRFGLTADRRLSATINGEILVSDSIVSFNNMLHQVAYVLDQSGDKTTVKFYDGSKAIGSKQLKEHYEGASSGIVLGSDFDFTRETLYKGEMLEFRLWNRAMDAALLGSYSKKKLTGYETGLLDYYPLNEGDGEWAYDKAPGSMDLSLVGATWKRPVGISMAINGDKGLRLKPDKFMRTKNHDYTLTFWFRTNDENATLFSNGEAKRDQDDQINIGVKDRKLYVRSQGFEKETSAFVSEGSWHHFAMTVSRSQNVSNVYVDKRLVESFPADSVAGIVGDHIALGATYVDKNTPTNVMNGHIDELGMFESVLPLNLIKEYSNHTPIGTMSAMLAYLDFGRSEKKDDNQQHLEPTGISLKRYVNERGDVTVRRDTLVANADVEAMAARDFYAPMVSNAQLDNLMYSYVANGNELYMNIKQPDYMVEKTNIYVTVKEVADLQGNTMESPVTMNLYVYRNPLRWDVKRIERDVDYGNGLTFEATVKNLSGVKQNFKLEDLPLWINASQTQGVLDALDEQKIAFTVSDYINIGTYNEQIALVGDNKMSEPLPITLRVRGDEPDWAVPDSLIQKNQTMMMVARVKIDGVVASSKEDILAVFDENYRPLGMTHIEVNDNANANEALAYLTIYSDHEADASLPTLSFRFFDASKGKVYSVKPADGKVYAFANDAIIGTDVNPVILQNSYDDVQTVKLQKGWNWVSFNVIPKEGTTLGQFLNSMSKWDAQDMIIAVNGTKRETYKCYNSKKTAIGQKWDKGDQVAAIDPAQMYNISSESDKTIYLEGEFARRYIVVHKNWNRIGYNSTINLPIAQALADYTEQAQVGDVVKSQDQFAILSQTATGLAWKGSLQYMEAGKGYMLKRLADSEVKFLYPLYLNDSRYSSTNETAAPKRSAVSTATTMNIVAAVEGVETEAGDKLVVFRDGDRMAEAELTIDDETQHLFYLNIGSDANNNETLTFVLERDGETIAMTGSHINYVADKVLGTPEQPTAINFTALDQMPHDGQWYNVGGVLIGKKPTQSGVYIYNGKAVVVK